VRTAPFRTLLAAVFTLPGPSWAERDGDLDGFPDRAELSSESDRRAFRAWACAIAVREATDDAAGKSRVRDCAGLLVLAYREALKAHDRSWMSRWAWDREAAGPDVSLAYPPPGLGGGLFLDVPSTLMRPEPEPRFVGSATAAVLRDGSAFLLGADLSLLGDGDLLFFHHPDQGLADHGMLHCGGWVVYHTGPGDSGPGRIKRVSLSALLNHPDPSWRPVSWNPHFMGAFRWRILH